MGVLLSVAFCLFVNMYAGAIDLFFIAVMYSANMAIAALGILLHLAWAIFHILVITFAGFHLMMLTVVYLVLLITKQIINHFY